MIAHCQGAVQLAEAQLKYGKRPELRKTAKGIIRAQQQEIAFMKSGRPWNGVKQSRLLYTAAWHRYQCGCRW